VAGGLVEHTPSSLRRAYSSAAVVVTWQTCTGTVRWPSKLGIVWLLLTGFFMQFLGNVTFQWGLHLGGITLTVPLSHATLLISGALLGLWMLGERVSPRSLAAILVLIVSISILSYDADDLLKTNNAPVGLAIVNGLLAGIGWGSTGTNHYPLFRVDQIWVSRHFRAESVTAQKTIHSDHRMVLCDLIVE